MPIKSFLLWSCKQSFNASFLICICQLEAEDACLCAQLLERNAATKYTEVPIHANLNICTVVIHSNTLRPLVSCTLYINF